MPDNSARENQHGPDGESSRGEPLIRIRDLCKSYGELTVLDHLSVDIPRGQRVAVVGSSGSGKSTLLRLLMALERPTSGTIRIQGDYLWHLEREGKLQPAGDKHVRRVRRKVGMVFQHFNLFPHRKVLSNITLAPRRVLGLSRQEARRRALDLLDQVGLADKQDKYPGELSGGQKQRVAIARALALEPSVMLFDEVTSALDPELVGEVQRVLRDLASRRRMTMLVVTHEIGFAEEIAERVLFLDAGRIAEDNPPEVIFHEPEQERTREFLRERLASKGSR